MKIAEHHGTALITGGSSGIGLEYARQLSALGYSLVLVSNRAEELVAASESFPGAQTVCMDLAEHGAAAKLMAWCSAKGIDPEVLVNNAGMFFMEYLSPENLPKAQAMLALHTETVTELCILSGARMKERGSGYILNMSSMTARIPAPGIAIYSATKAYLKSFGRSFSYEMRPFGVKVTTVCPSAIDTGLYPLPERLRGFLKAIGIIRSPQWLVRRALRALFRGRRVVSPGLMNFFLPLLVAALPSALIDRLGMRWINR